jgi:hypothetical protein
VESDVVGSGHGFLPPNRLKGVLIMMPKVRYGRGLEAAIFEVFAACILTLARRKSGENPAIY